MWCLVVEQWTRASGDWDWLVLVAGVEQYRIDGACHVCCVVCVVWSFVFGCASAGRGVFVVFVECLCDKLQRAHGGCLGIKSR